MPEPVKTLSSRWAGPLILVGITAVVVALIAATRLLGPGQAAGRTAGPPGPSPSAAAHGADPVGALFQLQNGELGSHFCTASVVASPAGNLLITAAHCVAGVSLAAPRGLAFAPGYADGRYPRGLWQVTRMFVDSRWTADQDPDYDVAFLVVKPLAGPDGPGTAGGPGSSVQRAAGADQIRFDAPLPEPIRAIGYPDAGEAPVACSSRAVAFRPASLNQVMFACPGFTDGTSGSPMLTGFRSGAGTVIGVIGGYEQGGYSPSISYSSAFTAAIRALYQRAIEASPPG